MSILKDQGNTDVRDILEKAINDLNKDNIFFFNSYYKGIYYKFLQ